MSPGELSIRGPVGARDGVRVLGFLLGSLQVWKASGCQPGHNEHDLVLKGDFKTG